MRGAGGTPGGLGGFFAGAAMVVAGAYLLLARVTVSGGYWDLWGYNAFGLSLLLLGQMPTLWLAALVLVGTGAAMVLTLSASNALVQTLLPDRLRGRVMSIFYMTVMGAGPVGSLAAGSLAA